MIFMKNKNHMTLALNLIILTLIIVIEFSPFKFLESCSSSVFVFDSLEPARPKSINIDYDFYRKHAYGKNASTYIKTPTPDKSGQAVHPDILYFKDGFGKYKYLLAFTPYPFSNDDYENPCLLVSNNGTDFSTLQGLKNPIVPPPSDVNTGGHYSDTDIAYYSGKLILHYVYNKVSVMGPGKIYRITSQDGIKWTKPEMVYIGDKNRECCSPSIIVEGEHIKMWYINGEGNISLVKSTDDEATWSQPINCSVNMGKWKAWHIDMVKNANIYESLICARLNGSMLRAVFYGRSSDGVNWKISNYPILFPSKTGWDDREIYRSTLLVENGRYRIWYSARNHKKTWHIGYTELTTSELNASLNN